MMKNKLGEKTYSTFMDRAQDNNVFLNKNTETGESLFLMAYDGDRFLQVAKISTDKTFCFEQRFVSKFKIHDNTKKISLKDLPIDFFDYI